jgi:predicted permease
MNALRRFLSRLVVSVTRRRDDDRLKEEIEEHLALHAADLVRAGLTSVEARRQARIRFGGVESTKEEYRDRQRLPVVETVLRDLRVAVRQLRKAPLFAVTATISLAIGIGANAAIFALVDRVLLRSLPVTDPHELVYVVDQQRLEGGRNPRFSYPFYTAVKDADALNGIAAHFLLPFNAITGDEIARVPGELVSGNYFSVLGVGTELGRPLTVDDDRTPGAHPVAVISDRLWRRSFGGDRSVLGRTVQINRSPFTIVGVAASGFAGTQLGSPTDIWLPLAMQREVGRDFLTDTRTTWIEMIGRLKPGGTVDGAAAGLSAFVERATPTQPGSNAVRIALLPAARGGAGVRNELGAALRVLFVLTGLALILACVNVASLLVVRTVQREKEIAVRLALGARRAVLVRQLLTETLVLAIGGGAIGLLLATPAARLLIASQPGPLEIDPRVDVRVFFFGLAACLATGLVAGLAPVLASGDAGFGRAFGHPAATSRGPRSRRILHAAIVTSQIAVSLVILIGAALFVQSVRHLGAIDPGFRADHLLLMSIHPGAAGYDAPRAHRFWRDALDRIGRIHGVESVSLGRLVPLAPGGQRQNLRHEASAEVLSIETNVVGPSYFRTLAIPVIRGREFSEQDGAASRRVAIVNDRLAGMIWPGQDPIGKEVRVGGSNSPLAEVIAVVRSARHRNLTSDAPAMVYLPVLQSSSSDPMTLHVRTAGEARELAATIRQETRALDPALPMFEVNTLEDLMNASFSQTRRAAVLTTGFGIVALLLSGIGVYGVTALAVSRRTRDIAIRRTLGAQPHHIARVIGLGGFRLVVAGLSLGLLGAFGFGRIAGVLLYGIAPGDPLTFASMAALLAVVSLIAIAVPARAAIRIDPIAGVRTE